MHEPFRNGGCVPSSALSGGHSHKNQKDTGQNSHSAAISAQQHGMPALWKLIRFILYSHAAGRLSGKIDPAEDRQGNSRPQQHA